MDNGTDTANEKTERWLMTYALFSRNKGLKGMADAYLNGPVTKKKLLNLENDILRDTKLKECKIFLVNSLKVEVE